jgi:hypothetical protein
MKADSKIKLAFVGVLAARALLLPQPVQADGCMWGGMITDSCGSQCSFTSFESDSTWNCCNPYAGCYSYPVNDCSCSGTAYS